MKKKKDQEELDMYAKADARAAVMRRQMTASNLEHIQDAAATGGGRVTQPHVTHEAPLVKEDEMAA